MTWRTTNDYIALKATDIFSSMGFFWFCVGLVIIPILPHCQFAIIPVQYLSSTVIQLCALPLLGVSGVLVGRKMEQRAEQDHKHLDYIHEAISKDLEELKALNTTETKELKVLLRITQHLGLNIEEL